MINETPYKDTAYWQQCLQHLGNFYNNNRRNQVNVVLRFIHSLIFSFTDEADGFRSICATINLVITSFSFFVANSWNYLLKQKIEQVITRDLLRNIRPNNYIEKMIRIKCTPGDSDAESNHLLPPFIDSVNLVNPKPVSSASLTRVSPLVCVSTFFYHITQCPIPNIYLQNYATIFYQH